VGQANDITNPANVGPWTKIFMGWLTPTEITNDGRYDIEASFSSEQVYKVSSGLPEGEYFLLENKNAVGWDVNMWGGGGIVIWHIDETLDGITSTEAKVAIVQADGNDDLEGKVNLGDEGDIWKSGGSKSELSDTGNPNTKSRRNGQSSGIRLYDFSENGNVMSFSIEGVRPATPTPVNLTPTPAPDGTGPGPTPAPDGTDPSGAARVTRVFSVIAMLSFLVL
jgi:immune inhibitor A